MKLCVCVVHQRDKNRLRDELIKAGFKFTVLGSTGGFLGESNATFLVGIEPQQKDALFAVIEANCCSREQVVNVGPWDSGNAGGFIPTPVKVPVGGAMVFVLPVDEIARF